MTGLDNLGLSTEELAKSVCGADDGKSSGRGVSGLGTLGLWYVGF